jgi:hypothetical protein
LKLAIREVTLMFREISMIFNRLILKFITFN